MRLGVLELPLELVNLYIVRKFYVNAKPTEDAPLANISWVWGQQVPFSTDVIHAYIEDHYVANLRKSKPFEI